jgi:hypothetical protein
MAERRTFLEHRPLSLRARSLAGVGCGSGSWRLVHGDVRRRVSRSRRTGRSCTTACLQSPTLRLQPIPAHDVVVDLPTLVVWIAWRQALCDERGTEDGRQDPANLPAESQAECTRACEGGPVALSL